MGEDLLRCLDSIYSQSTGNQVVVVDNASTDNSLESARRRFQHIEVIGLLQNTGVAAGWNAGARLARDSPFIFITQDVFIANNFQIEIERVQATVASTAIIGAVLLYPETSIVQHAGAVISYPDFQTQHVDRGKAYESSRYETVSDQDYVTGAVFGCRPEAFWRLGGSDEAFRPAYFEDVDLCIRARTCGWRVVLCPTALAFHRESTVLGVESAQFVSSYTRNRFLCAFKHLTPVQIRHDFVDYEVNRLNALPECQRQFYRRLYRDELIKDIPSVFAYDKHDLRKAEVARIALEMILIRS